MGDTDRMYSTQEVADELGVTYRRVNYWVHQDYVTPTVPSSGIGSPRRWSEKDLERARVVHEMIRRPTPEEIRRKVAEVDC